MTRNDILTAFSAFMGDLKASIDAERVRWSPSGTPPTAVELMEASRERIAQIKSKLETVYFTPCQLAIEDYNRLTLQLDGELRALGFSDFPVWWGELTPAQYLERRKGLGCYAGELTGTPGVAPADITISSDIVIAGLIVGGLVGLAAIALLIRSARK